MSARSTRQNDSWTMSSASCACPVTRYAYAHSRRASSRYRSPNAASERGATSDRWRHRVTRAVVLDEQPHPARHRVRHRGGYDQADAERHRNRRNEDDPAPGIVAQRRAEPHEQEQRETQREEHDAEHHRANDPCLRGFRSSSSQRIEEAYAALAVQEVAEIAG